MRNRLAAYLKRSPLEPEEEEDEPWAKMIDASLAPDPSIDEVTALETTPQMDGNGTAKRADDSDVP
jgi:hypothetical protein